MCSMQHADHYHPFFLKEFTLEGLKTFTLDFICEASRLFFTVASLGGK